LRQRWAKGKPGKKWGKAGKCCRLLATFKSDKHSLLSLHVVARVFLHIVLFFLCGYMCFPGAVLGPREWQSLAGVTRLQAAT